MSHPTTDATPESPVQETSLDVAGMTCAACARRVERALTKVEGVSEAYVNFATHQATVQHSGLANENLVSAVVKAGYGAEVRPADAHASHTALDARAPSATDLWLALVLTVPVVVVSMAFHMRPMWVNALLGVLAAVVTFWCGRGFFSKALAAARYRTTSMDTLVALGSGAAWIYSAVAMVVYRGNLHQLAEHIYFETGAVIVSLILLGRHLEARAKHRMSGAIRALMELAPDTARLIHPDGREESVPTSDVRPGQTLRLGPGERVAVDGEVYEGRTFIDESMVTGEPMPVSKEPGAPVTAGTVNGDGAILYKALRTGGDTTLAQITRMVERAQGSKAPVQNMADRVSAIFVPIVIGIAVVTALVWGLSGAGWDAAVMASVAVLVIACPCALGLAVPTALIVGTGRGAQLGILIKDGSVLERLANVSRIVFDKTGTLTEGRPVVSDVWTSTGWSDEEALAFVASLEEASGHPLGKAVIAEANERGLSWPVAAETEAVGGKGVKGLVGGRPGLVGSRRMVESVPADVSDALDNYEKAGMTAFLARRETDDWAVIAVNDTVRETTPTAINELHRLEMKTTVLTGDNVVTAQAVAEAVGIDDVKAEVLPGDKAATVEKLRKTGSVAMVGDGINDAPALAQADVGIAMGTGTDVAMETAGVTLLNADLRSVPVAIRLARSTFSTIRWNLFWAFAYNTSMIPLAAFGKLSPMFAAGAMALSSVSVVLNSLRLKNFRA